MRPSGKPTARPCANKEHEFLNDDITGVLAAAIASELGTDWCPEQPQPSITIKQVLGLFSTECILGSSALAKGDDNKDNRVLLVFIYTSFPMVVHPARKLCRLPNISKYLP